MFFPGLLHSQVPAFRDGYHFYYPQAVWLQQAAQQGSYFPSWNPSEGLGVSLAGQPSAALYYPLRWLWWLPGLSVAQKFSLVIVVHLLIAAGGLQLAARKLGCSQRAGWLAAVSFCLSCPVFFQHTNLIYLCSAAWVGFALAAVFDVLQSTNLRRCAVWCAVFACATSLMLLAGDPQSAANSFIVASVIFAAHFGQRLVRSFAQQRVVRSQAAAVARSHRTAMARVITSLGGSALWLLGALGMVVVLCCVQWLPAWRWAAHSGRAHVSVEQPRQSADATVPSMRTAAPAVKAVLEASRPVAAHRYDFSLSPWHALSCLWPTLGGYYLPSNSRSFAILPAEGRMWIPSLYFGLWPCLLLLLSVFRKRGRLATTLKVLALVALLAALGNYSVVWLLRQLLSGIGLSALAALLPKDHVSSLTWMINGLVPGYAMFRYPAKWTVWIVAAASLLAALQLGSRCSERCHLPKRLLVSVLALSLTGLAVSGGLWIAIGLGYSCDAWLAATVVDPWLGPPNTRAIAVSLAIAFAVPSGVLGLDMFRGWLLGREIGSPAESVGHWGSSIGLITLVEMTLCASCWVDFLPAPSFDRASLPSMTSERGMTGLDKPFVWSNRGQADLLRDHVVQSPHSYAEDQAGYQQLWLLGKLGLLADVRCLHAALSIDPRELVQLRAWLGRHDQQVAEQPEVDCVLRELGVTHRLARRRPAQDAAGAQSAVHLTEFTWQAIADPLPLCQVLLGPAKQASAPRAASWRWSRPDRLVIQLADVNSANARDRVLLVRQTNDDGWLAHDTTGRSLKIRHQTLFVEVELTDSVDQVTLSRKWFW